MRRILTCAFFCTSGIRNIPVRDGIHQKRSSKDLLRSVKCIVSMYEDRVLSTSDKSELRLRVPR